nr:MAG TPA: cell wall surface anchor family protein [Bacteriophage sp.]
MSVQKFLDKIKNGRYGADITDAIIGGIKKCYDDASVNHDNANMEVKMARGTHNTLNDRLDKSEQKLDETNAQLSKTPKYVCVDDYISKLPSDLETIERTTRGIENAISSLESGDTLFFESRKYTINRTLQPTVSNITILGKYSNVSFPRDLDGVVWKFEDLVNINIEGMAASNSTSAQTWIKAKSTHHLHIYKCATDGMKLGFDLNDCYWTRIESVRMQSVYQAFNFQSGTNAFHLANVSIHGGGIPSTIYECTTGGNITGCSFESTSGAINIVKSFGINIDGNYFEGYNDEMPYYISIGNANYLFTCGANISGNLFYNGCKSAILLHYVKGVTIHGNSIMTKHAVELYSYEESKQYNISYVGNYYSSSLDGANEFLISGKTSQACISPSYNFPIIFKDSKVDANNMATGDLAVFNKDGHLLLTGGEYKFEREMVSTCTTVTSSVSNGSSAVVGKLGQRGTILIHSSDWNNNCAYYIYWRSPNNNKVIYMKEIVNDLNITLSTSETDSNLTITNNSGGNLWLRTSITLTTENVI